MTDISHPPVGPAAISRRRFISGLTVLIVTAAAGTVGAQGMGLLHLDGADGQAADGWLTICSLAALAAGAPLGFPFARRLRDGWTEARQTGIAYAISRDGRSAQVFANVCTHGGCRIIWQQGRQAFVCPCHESEYAMDGTVLSGLPPRPLEQFPTRVVNGLVQIQMET